MDLPVGKQSKEFWLWHIEAAANFSGSRAAYCRQNGLVFSRFDYFRKKFSKKSNFSEVKPVSHISPESPIAKLGSYPQRLPDPKWLSALIRELSRG